MHEDTETTTLFLRGLPARLVREVKAEAARRGVTLARHVADMMARSIEAASSPGDEETDDDAALDASFRWYEANRSRILKKHAGEYVAILDEAVVDHDRDFSALAERVFQRHGVRSIFMPRVVGKAKEPVLRARSPRRVGE